MNVLNFYIERMPKETLASLKKKLLHEVEAHEYTQSRLEDIVKLKNKIASLEDNLAEERANHETTREERDGFEEKAESLEGHLEAVFKDLREASNHLFVHYMNMKRRRALAEVNIEIEELTPEPEPKGSEWHAQQPHIITLPDHSPLAIAVAAAIGTVMGGTFLFFTVWLLIRFAV